MPPPPPGWSAAQPPHPPAPASAPPQHATTSARELAQPLVEALEAMRKEMRGELDQRLAPLERENAQLRTELVAAQRAAADMARQLDEQNSELAARRRQASELAARQADGEAWRQEAAGRFLTLERKLADSQANVASLAEATAEAAASSRSGGGVSRSEFEESKRGAEATARAAAAEAVAELRASLETSAASAAVAAPTESPDSSTSSATAAAISEVKEAVSSLRQRLDGAESVAARALGCAEDAAAGGRAELGALRSRVDAVTDRSCHVLPIGYWVTYSDMRLSGYQPYSCEID